MSMTPEELQDYEPVPEGIEILVMADMICPDGHFHQIPMVVQYIHKQGILHQVALYKARLVQELGWREATATDRLMNATNWELAGQA